MKFLVFRTSDTHNKKPCEGAVLEEYVYCVERRPVDDPAKLRWKFERERWFKEGWNHRVENGQITRDRFKHGWFVEINTLEELLAFQNECGHAIIVSSRLSNPEIMAIEIFDDYH